MAHDPGLALHLALLQAVVESLVELREHPVVAQCLAVRAQDACALREDLCRQALQHRQHAALPWACCQATSASSR
jgi:hypothetical protein